MKAQTEYKQSSTPIYKGKIMPDTMVQGLWIILEKKQKLM